MPRRLVIPLLFALILLSMSPSLSAPLPALAQGDDDTPLPACTPDDFAPLREVVGGMVEGLDRAGTLGVDDMLRWRATISELDLTPCAEMTPALLQLQYASDELLIGALLIERGDRSEEAATAINLGLVNLVGMRFALAGTPDTGGAEVAFMRFDGDSVLAAFEAAGLPFDDVSREAGPAGGGAPRTEAERITFSLPTVFDGGVGQVLIFARQADRNTWLSYLFSGQIADPGHISVYENVVMQLSPDLDLATARAFRAALEGLD